jgi:P pilus assembly chaperone PapD
MRSVHSFSLTSVLASLVFLVLPNIAVAAPDLMLYPTRVVMNDRQRSAQVDIVNTSEMQASYRISLVRKRMTETGEFQDVDKPEEQEKFADDLVKYSPRQVTLLPGAGQTIRLMYKMPAELPEGEYRSHLLFAKIPAAKSTVPEVAKQSEGTITMTIPINVGVSIPIIVRRGKLTAQATIDPQSLQLATLQPNQQAVSFTVLRSGTRSVYGDITVYRGDDKVAGISGIAIYTPNSKRRVTLPVLEPNHLKAGDQLRITFTEPDEKKPVAEATVRLQ